MESHPWPLFDLRIRTPRLELRLPSDADLVGLIGVVNRGVHPPDEMPFSNGWTRPGPQERARNLMQWHWTARGTWRPERWKLPFGLFLDGEPIGEQDLSAHDFAERCGVLSGSWIGQQWQGQGYGTEMRQAIVHLAFAGLGAQFAESSFWDGNDASRRVSEKVGYQPNGIEYRSMDGGARRMRRVLLERQAWESRQRDDIEIIGLELCLPLFGIA